MWDPFLMKKLIKNEICGSVNSAYVHCSQQKVNICGRNTPKRVKKKKKKKRNKTQLGNADLESKQTLGVFPRVVDFLVLLYNCILSAIGAFSNILSASGAFFNILSAMLFPITVVRSYSL